METEKPSMVALGLGFGREMFFRKTRFASGASGRRFPWGTGGISASWLVNLREGSAITFDQCSFGNDDVQLRALGYAKEGVDGNPEVHGIESHADKEEEATGPKAEKALEMLIPPSGQAEHVLRRVTLLGCRDVGRLDIVSATRELILRGGNRLQALRLPGDDPIWLPARVSLGLFEEIDPRCRDPLRHRDTFLELRQLGTDSKDDALVRASAAQIDRIEYFLLQDDPVTLSNGVRSYTDHLQRRLILGWGYWVSNFNRSWARCLAWLAVWYAGTTLVACCLVWPHLESGDIVSILTRPLHQVPFLARTIEDHLPGAWDSVATSAKAWVSTVGLVQSGVTGLLSFSLIRSLRR